MHKGVVKQRSEVMEEHELNVLPRTVESATPCEVVPCAVHISGRLLHLICDYLYSFQVPGLVPCLEAHGGRIRSALR